MKKYSDSNNYTALRIINGNINQNSIQLDYTPPQLKVLEKNKTERKVLEFDNSILEELTKELEAQTSVLEERAKGILNYAEQRCR